MFIVPAFSVNTRMNNCEGALKGARRFILSVGRERLGAPDTQDVTAIEAITDLEQLEQLALRLLHVSSWQRTLDAADSTSEQQSFL